MTKDLVCRECDGTMQEGYILDAAPGIGIGVIQSSWMEGKPTRGFLSLTTKGKRSFYILAYRCEVCGLLKFYAPPENKI